MLERFPEFEEFDQILNDSCLLYAVDTKDCRRFTMLLASPAPGSPLCDMLLQNWMQDLCDSGLAQGKWSS